MTALGDLSLLTELLDRQSRYLLGLKGTAVLRRLPRYLAFLQQDPRIAGVLGDFRAEAQQTARSYCIADAAARSALLKLWRAHGNSLARRLANVDAEQRDVYGAMADYEQRVRAKHDLAFPRSNKSEREEVTERLIAALRHWTKWANDLDGSDEQVAALGSQVEHVSRVYEHAARELGDADKSLPWAAFLRLKEMAEAMNPVPPTERDDLARWAQHIRDVEFRDVLERGDAADLDIVDDLDVTTAYEQVRTSAELIHEEIQVRIGMGRSRLGLVARCAAKCEHFDAVSLRQLCAQRGGTPEQKLTLHLARYVFDAGLNPILDPTMGGLRPDIVHLGPGEPLYVEAKQYKGRYPRRALMQAYSQVWSTWSRVRKLHPLNEAFIVVFRRAGPLVQLPDVVRHEGLTLFSILADISTEAGSRERGRAVVITEADLLPNDATPSTRRRPSGGGGRANRARRRQGSGR
jgi:hypothetical protein